MHSLLAALTLDSLAFFCALRTPVHVSVWLGKCSLVVDGTDEMSLLAPWRLLHVALGESTVVASLDPGLASVAGVDHVA